MSMPLDATLVLNSNSKLIRALGDAAEAGANEHSERVAKQVYTLALLAQRQLSAEELKSFLSGSFSLLEEVMRVDSKCFGQRGALCGDTALTACVTEP